MVYLLHFSEPYKHARHYLGYSANVSARLERHSLGHGARLIEVILAAGLSFELVRTWDGDRKLERRLHKRGGSRLCPICNPKLINELPRAVR